MSRELPMRKYVAPELVLGHGAASLSGRYARNLGAKRVLVVTDPGIIAAGWTSPVVSACEAEGLAVCVYDGVSPNPRSAEVARGVQAFRDGACDAIVAVGGGSPMDAAKGVAACVANAAEVASFEGVDRIPLPGPALVCVPSTAGTGSEVSRFSIIVDEGRRVKMAIVSPKVVPDAALVDPRLLGTVPAELAAATGLDALTHAFEAYVSSASSPLTDMDARQAVRLISGNLKSLIADPGDAEAQGAMMLASLLAGRAFSNAGLGVVHAMAHALGGLLDAPHGLCNAILLEAGIAVNFESSADRYADLARDLGASEDELAGSGALRTLLSLVRSLRESVGIVSGLGRLGASSAEIPKLADFASRDACLATNPVPLGAADIARLYAGAL